MLTVALAGTFAASLEAPLRAELGVPCEILVADESAIVGKLSDVDVLVTMSFTSEMGAAARRLRLVQVPGAGLDRIDRAALPAGAALANAYGHEVGIAEYILAAMLTLTRDFVALDAALRRGVWASQWAVGTPPPPPWPELAGKTLGILGYGASALPSPVEPADSTCGSARSGVTSRAPAQRTWCCSVAWRFSTKCCGVLITWQSRCRPPPPREVSSARRSLRR